LMQQGMQQPQGQMVSGHYVAPSITQNLAGLANMYFGQRGIEKAEQAQLDLAKRLRSDEASAAADYMKEKIGTPAEMYPAQAGPMPTGGNIPLQESKAAVLANPQAAYANLYANPKSSAAQRQFAFGKMNEGPIKVGLEDTLLDPFTMKPVYTGAGKPRAPLQIDTGTAIELRDPNNPTVVLQRIPKSVSPADAARLADEGITGYGGGGGGQPMVRTGVPIGQQQGVPTGQPQGQQTVMPPLNVAGLSPKAAREAQAEQAKNYQENVKNAYEVAKIFPAIEKALPNAHGSGIGNIMGGVANFVGYESSQNAADAELKVMSDKLLKAVPRFSGPQSDKDVASYKEAAGSIGDASLPINVRMAALNTIKELNKPYAPNLNWDSQAPKQPDKVSLGASPMYATNGNQRIVSNDGGKTWQPAR